jgi:hypothetical protein
MTDHIKFVDRGFIEFLLADLDVALTFMDVAETTEFRGTAERNHRNARNAYDMVIEKLREVTPTPAEQAKFDEKLVALRERLRAVGQL